MQFNNHFGPLDATISDFALRHNLHIEIRGVPDGPAARLMFTHPNDGQASLDLFPHSTDKVVLESVWWQDDYGTFTRLECTAQTVEAALRNELSAILALQAGDWTQVVKDYGSIWGQYSKAESEAMTPRLPVPVLGRK